MNKSQVIVLGDACVDMLIRLPDRTRKRTDLSNSVPQLHGGGTAANVAVALARLDVPVALVSAVGDDGYGRWILEDLVREGVDIQYMSVLRNAFTPMVIALVETDGERMMVVWPPEGGAQTQLQKDVVDRAFMSSASWLHTSGMCLRTSPARDSVLYAMKLARKAGLTVSLDLNLRMELLGLDDLTREMFERAIELSDVVFGNAEEEILQIAGKDSIVAGAQYLSEGKRIVIARQGGRGAFVFTPKETFRVPAFQTEIVDSVGAGDAFNGGFIAARMAKLDLREAVKWGNAVAAFKIGHTGARALPYINDLRKMFKK